jgi:hypothetical protein
MLLKYAAKVDKGSKHAMTDGAVLDCLSDLSIFAAANHEEDFYHPYR